MLKTDSAYYQLVAVLHHRLANSTYRSFLLIFFFFFNCRCHLYGICSSIASASQKVDELGDLFPWKVLSSRISDEAQLLFFALKLCRHQAKDQFFLPKMAMKKKKKNFASRLFKLDSFISGLFGRSRFCLHMRSRKTSSLDRWGILNP